MSPMGGLGTTIGYATTQGGTITLVSGAVKIKPPKLAAKDINVDPDLAGDGHHQHTPGSDDSEVCTFSVPYSAAAYATLLALRTTPSNRQSFWWTIIRPDGGGTTGPGYVPSVVEPEEITADAAEMIEVTVQPTDAWVPVSS